MRFTTFRNFVMLPAGLLLGLLVVGGFALLCRSCGSTRTTPESAPPIAQRENTTTAPTTTQRPLAGTPVAASDDPRRDKLIVDYLAAHPQAVGDKAKDVLPREAFKVSLYADNGSAAWNRLKIDYNRNEKWDEKWDLENGQPVKRHVASRDNEVYDKEYRWQGGLWVEKK